MSEENPGAADSLPYHQDRADNVWMKFLKLERMHRELSHLYRAKSRDRRSIAALWYYIDGLELDLRSEGVQL